MTLIQCFCHSIVGWGSFILSVCHLIQLNFLNKRKEWTFQFSSIIPRFPHQLIANNIQKGFQLTEAKRNFSSFQHLKPPFSLYRTSHSILDMFSSSFVIKSSHSYFLVFTDNLLFNKDADMTGALSNYHFKVLQVYEQQVGIDSTARVQSCSIKRGPLFERATSTQPCFYPR